MQHAEHTEHRQRGTVVTTPPTVEQRPYACPMHPEVRSDEPGTCPICKMALEPVEGAASTAKPPENLDWDLHRELRWRGGAWGAAAGTVLIGVYVATVGLANSFSHVFEEIGRLWYWMLPLVLGFSVQVGLFVYARRGARARDKAARPHAVIASGSASTVSMVACCAHHLTDVLPVVGLAGAVSVLATYQSVFLLLGVLSNLVGLVYVLGLLRRHRLSPARSSLLSHMMRVPFDRALIPVATVAAAIFIIALLRAR